ncbi:MAG: hypothetical protein JXL80_07235 [Planctomycetes bacterium]|nr:hypothetical protein [Planctomycetota bacterium]
MTRLRIVLVATAILFCTATASLGDAATEARAHRDALSLAFQDLYDRLGRMQLTPDVRVEDFLATGPDVRASACDAVRQAARVSPPQHYSDGVVVAQVDLPIQDVTTRLSDVCGDVYRGDRFKAEDFRKILLYTDRLGLWGIGQSRGQAPVGLVAAGPVGWEEAGVFGRLRARHQAAASAYRLLLQRIRTLSLSPSKTVGDFVDSDSRIAADLEAFVRSHPISGEARYLPERLCEVTASIDMTDLASELKSLANAYGTTGEYAPESFHTLTPQAGQSVLQATGVAVAEVPSDGEPAAMPAAEEVWTEVVSADPPEGVRDEQQARLLTLKAAEAEARKRFRDKIVSQQIIEGLAVSDWMLKDVGARNDVELLLKNQRVVQMRKLKNGGAEITAELPVTRLMELLDHYRSRTRPAEKYSESETAPK